MPKTTEELYQELLQQGQNYQNQANDLLAQYDNRGTFSYDPQNDPLYQSVKNQYVHQGRRAMEDTMGQAAGLTGGYGSSYGQSVGNQAYNEYLTQLNAQIPGLAQQARANWDAEGNRLLDRYNLAMNAANTAYGQSRDALGDMRYDKEYADQQAYQQWQMDRANQSDAREYAMMLIQMGKTPSADVISAAGMNPADVQTMVNFYANQLAGYGSGGSGSGSRGSRGSTGGDGNGDDKDATPDIQKPGGKTISNKDMEMLWSYYKQYGPEAAAKYMKSRFGGYSNYNAVARWLSDRGKNYSFDPMSGHKRELNVGMNL